MVTMTQWHKPPNTSASLDAPSARTVQEPARFPDNHGLVHAWEKPSL